MITLHVGRQMAVPGAVTVPVPQPLQSSLVEEITGASWESLDHVDLGEEFLRRIPLLKQCP